jgi:hypothetical protein
MNFFTSCRKNDVSAYIFASAVISISRTSSLPCLRTVILPARRSRIQWFNPLRHQQKRDIAYTVPHGGSLPVKTRMVHALAFLRMAKRNRLPLWFG